MSLFDLLDPLSYLPKEMPTLMARDPIPKILQEKFVSSDRKLQRGVVLKVEARNLKSLYLKFNHFGIYAGNNEVIHLKQDGIEKVKISEFTDGEKTCEVMGFKKKLNLTLEESYFRAYIELKTNSSEYNLLNNNCEHFALWCRTGEAISTQTAGTKSEEYDLIGSSNFIPLAISSINVPDLISKIYSLKFGMKELKTIDIKKIEDVNSES